MIYAFLHRQVLAKHPKLINLAESNLVNMVSIFVSWLNLAWVDLMRCGGMLSSHNSIFNAPYII